MTSGELQKVYGGWWGNHPVYPVRDWQAEVFNDDTRLGYWDWVIAKLDQEQQNQ